MYLHTRLCTWLKKIKAKFYIGTNTIIFGLITYLLMLANSTIFLPLFVVLIQEFYFKIWRKGLRIVALLSNFSIAYYIHIGIWLPTISIWNNNWNTQQLIISKCLVSSGRHTTRSEIDLLLNGVQWREKNKYLRWVIDLSSSIRSRFTPSCTFFP